MTKFQQDFYTNFTDGRVALIFGLLFATVLIFSEGCDSVPQGEADTSLGHRVDSHPHSEGRLSIEIILVPLKRSAHKQARIKAIDKITAYVFGGDTLVAKDMNIQENRFYGRINVPAEEPLQVDLVFFENYMVRGIGSKSDIVIPAGKEHKDTIEVYDTRITTSAPDSVSFFPFTESYVVHWDMHPMATGYELQESKYRNFSTFETIFPERDSSIKKDTLFFVEAKSGIDVLYYRSRILTAYGKGVWNPSGWDSTRILDPYPGIINFDGNIPPDEPPTDE